MARYKVVHEFRRENNCIGLIDGGGWGWAPYVKAFKFANYFKAKAAFDTLPVETKMYGFPMKPHFIKVEYTEAEKNMPGNEWMRGL